MKTLAIIVLTPFTLIGIIAATAVFCIPFAIGAARGFLR